MARAYAIEEALDPNICFAGSGPGSHLQSASSPGPMATRKVDRPVLVAAAGEQAGSLGWQPSQRGWLEHQAVLASRWQRVLGITCAP